MNESRPSPSPSSVDRWLVATAIVAALIVWGALPWQPWPLSYVVKAVPAAALAVLAWRHRATLPGGATLAAGLVWHGAGDVLLGFDRQRLFVPGLVAFLVGHLLYIRVLWRMRRPWRALPASRRAGAVAVVVLAVGVAAVLVPRLGGVLAVAVPLYVAAITTMAVLAWRGPGPIVGAPLGAASYVVSDALLATNRFLLPLIWAPAVIWPTYAAAQVLIVVGLVEASRRPAPPR